MDRLQLAVPTCNQKDDDESPWRIPSESAPMVPVTIEMADGVRLLLGGDQAGEGKPEIHVQRRYHGWMIAILPAESFDPSGYVFLLDDGRSFVISDRLSGSFYALEMTESVEDVEEIDQVKLEVLAYDQPTIAIIR